MRKMLKFSLKALLIIILLLLNQDVFAQEQEEFSFGNGTEDRDDLNHRQPTAADWERLFQKVSELEAEVKKLRESAKIREKLEVTDEEKKKKEQEILASAGRQYVLAREGTLELEYNGRYSYTSSDRIEVPLEVKHRNSHTFRHTFIADYAVRNNLTLNCSIPFVYKYDKTGTDSSLDESDVGNISLGFQWQPLKIKAGWPATIFFLSYSLDTGSSPYEIDPNNELSTGDGFDSVTLGVSFSKAVDPLVAFGSISYSYNNDATGISGGSGLKKVEPGDDISFSLGFGYALSYNVSMNMQYQHTYRMRTRLNWNNGTKANLATSTSSMFNIGTSWRLSPKKTFHFTLGIGLTNDAPDLALTLRLPFTFLL